MTTLPSAPGARALLATLVSVVCACDSGSRSVSIVPAHEFRGHETPAGDTLVLRGYLIQPVVFIPDLLTDVRSVDYDPEEAHWSVSDPAVAAIDNRGVLLAKRPGDVTITLEIRGVVRQHRHTVIWPMDSVVLRFATDVAAVGDTVEVLFMRYFADGSEAWGWDHAGMMTLDARDVTPAIMIPGEHPGRYRALRPGSYRLDARAHGHPISAVLRVVESDGSPPSYHRLMPGAPTRPDDRDPFLCYALEWDWSALNLRAYSDTIFDFLPSTVELDRTPVMPEYPRLGLRINSTPRDTLRMRRHWMPLSRDSISMQFLRMTDPPWTIYVRAAISGDTLHGSAATALGYTPRSTVNGHRIACD